MQESNQEIEWNQLFELFHQRYNTVEASERFIFTDRFFCQCLEILNIANDGPVLWDLIAEWLKHRPVPLRCGYKKSPEQQALGQMCHTLRAKIADYLCQTPMVKWHMLDSQQQRIIMLWHVLFLDSLSPLYIGTPAAKLYSPITSNTNEDYQTKVLDLLTTSIHYPFVNYESKPNIHDLWHSDIPLWCKMVLSLWILNTPYFNLTENDGRGFRHTADTLCSTLTEEPALVSMANMENLIKKMLSGFWTSSYLGENIVEEISALGSFTSKHMSRFYPQYANRLPTVEGIQDRKIRIGYISSRFYKHAVSYYMVNRVIYHDNSKFEVFLFSLGNYQDAMSHLLAKHVDHVHQFENMNEIDSIAQAVLDSRLDILIYADLGMDVTTYMLAGLRLAPIQCVLPGDYKTSGAPNIDYYFTGEFEVPDAQTYYSEKIIRLPGMGTAHHPHLLDEAVTPVNLRNIEEGNKVIPEDGVIFISCANGIKHQANRDHLFIEILHQASNAYILLKPFADASGVYPAFMNRIQQAAHQAGVDNRLFILPPLKEPLDVLGLVAAADVQLDTYPYGGWNTNLDALYLGVPIVTQEGCMSPSRWGANMLRTLGIQEGIATSEAEYVDWAIRFAQDKKLRQRVSLQIKDKVMVLFNGKFAQPAYEEALVNILTKEKKA